MAYSTVFRYLSAFAGIALATAARWLLDPALGDLQPYPTYFVAVIVIARYAGLGPSIFALLLCWWAANFFFVPPRFDLLPHGEGAQYAIGTATYFLVGIAAIAVCEAFRGAERRAAARAEELRVSFASIGDGIITSDTEGRITYLNGVAESLTGWTNAQATGQPLDAVFRIVDEQTRLPVVNPVLRALRDGLVVGLESHTLLVAKDRTQRPIDDSAAPIRDGDGNIVGCVLIFRDVSEQRKSDAALRASETRKASVIRASLDAIITIDADGKVIEFNPAAEALFGYSEAEARGKEVADLVIPADFQARHRAGMAHFRSTGDGPVLNRRLEMPARQKDGSEIVVELTITHIQGEDRSLFTGFVRDLTRQKAAERQIRDLIAQLQQADRLKDEFLATLSHELRGPLAPIANALGIIKLAAGSSEQIEKARNIMDRQVSQIVRLTDDLLDISRITSNKLELREQTIELAPVVEQAVETARTLMESAHHQLSVHLPLQPILLHGDPARLTQVFSNLLGNAAKYTEPGGRISLSAERQEGDVVVKVKDTGVGISRDMLPRVFDMFMQVDATSRRTQGGLGIGLALVKKLVEMHGGAIEAFSEGLDRGTEFVVRLPVQVSSRPGEAGSVEPDARMGQ